MFAHAPLLSKALPTMEPDYLACEEAMVDKLASELTWSDERLARIQREARRWVTHVRTTPVEVASLDSFMMEYDLSSEEGVALMCLAEALLRIPDHETADALIQDKIAHANWQSHMGQSDSTFVNAATWGLLLTGKMLQPQNQATAKRALKDWMARCSEPVVRTATRQAMRLMGKQFVMGETIEAAVLRADKHRDHGVSYSYDMLGEAAKTQADAEHYFQAYLGAIEHLKARMDKGCPRAQDGISVKLSALHPRYDILSFGRIENELLTRLVTLMEVACEANMNLTVDAEEADRLELQLALMEHALASRHWGDWDGFGLAVQAYQKRAPKVIDYLIELARGTQRRLMVRLVKGAYWDTEIKRAQVEGLPGYPVYTRKENTDLAYLACAARLLAAPDAIYPQFATHNAYTVAAVREMAGDQDHEFQRLHGMGASLYAPLLKEGQARVRIYAPVGGHQALLPYLVRRLLENGANTSFVNRIHDVSAPVESLIKHPIHQVACHEHAAHPNIPLPRDLYGARRANALGINMGSACVRWQLSCVMNMVAEKNWLACSLVGGNEERSGEPIKLTYPGGVEGLCYFGSPSTVQQAAELAHEAWPKWSAWSVERRAACLLRAADELEKNMPYWSAMLIHEAGKTVLNAISEVREAVDFCRYYAEQADLKLAQPVILPGPTGERNTLMHVGRGVVVCISPWNFPLAIFLGQVVSALVSGNTVLAKPAEQTPLVAMRAAQLLHRCGVPKDVLHVLLGTGELVGRACVRSLGVAGILFTGSTQTAKLIALDCHEAHRAIVPLIAETGGQNAMIVDSSALLEQVVTDVIRSAFDSCGQRCSALRVLYVQEEIAGTLITMLIGAMDQLSLGRPALLQTDVGPLIDEVAYQSLFEHVERMRATGSVLHQCDPVDLPHHLPPTLVEISSIHELEREFFGPILHVIRYRVSELDEVLQSINASGYGLTFGIHSRVEHRIETVVNTIRAGNVYVNRDIVGAVVGVQPFGGMGCSGTGPKAGGPDYLLRLTQEKTLSVNTTAQGGNTALLTMD